MHETVLIKYNEHGIYKEYTNRHRVYTGYLFEEGCVTFSSTSSVSFPDTNNTEMTKLRSYMVSLYAILQEKEFNQDEIMLFKILHGQARKLSEDLDFGADNITQLLFREVQEKEIENVEIIDNINEFLDINSQSLTTFSFALSWPIAFPFLKKNIKLLEELLPVTIINDNHNILTGGSSDLPHPLINVDVDSYEIKSIYKKSIIPDFDIAKDYKEYSNGKETEAFYEEEVGFSPSKELLLYLLFDETSELNADGINKLKKWAENNPYLGFTEKQVENILYLKVRKKPYELENFVDWDFTLGEGKALIECFNKCHFESENNYLKIILCQNKDNLADFVNKNNDLVKILIKGLDKTKGLKFDFNSIDKIEKNIDMHINTYKKIEYLYIINDQKENRTLFAEELMSKFDRFICKIVDKGNIEDEKKCLDISLVIKSKIDSFIESEFPKILSKAKVNRI